MTELLNKASEWFDRLLAGWVTMSEPIAQGREWILATFGQNGVYAAYFVIAALGVMLIIALLRMAVAALKYLVVPSVALAFVGSLLFPISFTTLLPVTVAGCTLILLFKG